MHFLTVAIVTCVLYTDTPSGHCNRDINYVRQMVAKGFVELRKIEGQPRGLTHHAAERREDQEFAQDITRGVTQAKRARLDGDSKIPEDEELEDKTTEVACIFS